MERRGIGNAPIRASRACRLILVGALSLAAALARSSRASPSPRDEPAPVEDRAASTPSAGRWRLQATFPGQLSSVSCGDASTCVAGGASGYVARSSDGGGSWTQTRIVSLASGIRAVSCVGTACLAVGQGGTAGTQDGGRTWVERAAPPLGRIEALSCSTAENCVVVGAPTPESFLEPAAAWTADAGRTWTQVELPLEEVPSLGSVGCAGELCVATGSYFIGYPRPYFESALLQSTDGGRSWSIVHIEDAMFPTFFGAVACPAAAHCRVFAGTVSGPDLFVTDDRVHWERRSAGLVPAEASELACADGDHCWVVGPSGNTSAGVPIVAAVTTDAGLTWTPQSIPSDEYAGAGGLTSIACPTTSRCVAVGDDTNALAQIVVTDDGGATWMRRSTPNNLPAAPWGIGCAPGTGTCWATTGLFFLGTSDGGRHWRIARTPDYVEAIACVDANRCWAVGATSPDTGSIDVTSDGGQHWTTQALVDSSTLTDISCPDAEHCWTVGFDRTGETGALFATSDGGLRWDPKPLPRGTFPLDIDCPDASHCVAVDSNGVALTTRDGGARWTRHTLPPELFDVADVTCTDRFHCWALGDGAIAATQDGGVTWRTQTDTTDLAYPDGLACLDRRTCVAVGTARTTRGAAIAITTDGGETWLRQEPPDGISALNGVACSTAIGCRAVGQVGDQPYGGGVIAFKQPTVVRPIRLTAAPR